MSFSEAYLLFVSSPFTFLAEMPINTRLFGDMVKGFCRFSKNMFCSCGNSSSCNAFMDNPQYLDLLYWRFLCIYLITNVVLIYHGSEYLDLVFASM